MKYSKIVGWIFFLKTGNENKYVIRGVFVATPSKAACTPCSVPFFKNNVAIYPLKFSENFRTYIEEELFPANTLCNRCVGLHDIAQFFAVYILIKRGTDRAVIPQPQ